MLTGIIGEKIRMLQSFDKAGRVWPVTEIKAGPVTVIQVKTQEKDGYSAVQLAYGAKKRATKPVLGHLKKAGVSQNLRALAEFRVSNGELPKPGEKITVDQIFTPGDLVRVTGTSKGKGFTGVIKRWGFAGGPASHGQTDRLRAPGSIGQTTTIGRVFRGKKMAGRKGQEKTTIKNLEVIKVDSVHNLLVLSGSVPGGPKSILKITKTGATKKPFEVYTKEGEKKTDRTKETKEEKNA